MIAERPTRKVLQELRSADFEAIRTLGSHTVWRHPSGVQVVVPDGHRTISPGVLRQVLKAIREARA